MAAPLEITPGDVDAFLAGTRFEGYHSVPLPFGRRVPGRDASRTADAVLADRVRGKTLLDVGTFYGFYPAEAIRRGARRAVGIEPRAERCDVARRIAALNGNRWEIAEAWPRTTRPSSASTSCSRCASCTGCGTPSRSCGASPPGATRR